MNLKDGDSTVGSGALSGVRVADFSRVLAGPYATMMLADLGADVIKIESPDGDGTRQWAPPVNAAGTSTYFAGANRGKRSVVCDLRDPAGVRRARGLAETADVVIENFRPGTMERFGLDYDAIAARNPGVVYCSISGFGTAGGADLPGYDLLVQAVGGLMSITGTPDADGGAPTKVGVALVDILTGQNAVIGIQAALRARDTPGTAQSGRGQRVSVTLLGSLLSALANQASSTLETGVSPERMGNAHPSIAPYETLRAADQPIAVAVGTDAQFIRLCEAIGAPQLATDERFATNRDRVAHRDALRELLETRLATRNADTWIDRLTGLAIPAGRVNSVGQALDLAESLGLDPVVSLEAPGADGAVHVVRSVANPVGLSETPADYVLPPPALGAHDTDGNWRTPPVQNTKECHDDDR